MTRFAPPRGTIRPTIRATSRSRPPQQVRGEAVVRSVGEESKDRAGDERAEAFGRLDRSRLEAGVARPHARDDALVLLRLERTGRVEKKPTRAEKRRRGS